MYIFLTKTSNVICIYWYGCVWVGVGVCVCGVEACEYISVCLCNNTTYSLYSTSISLQCPISNDSFELFWLTIHASIVNIIPLYKTCCNTLTQRKLSTSVIWMWYCKLLITKSMRSKIKASNDPGLTSVTEVDEQLYYIISTVLLWHWIQTDCIENG